MSGSQLLKLFLGVVEVKYFFETVEVFSDVVFVLSNSNGLVDLPLHYFHNYNYNLIFNLQLIYYSHSIGKGVVHCNALLQTQRVSTHVLLKSLVVEWNRTNLHFPLLLRERIRSGLEFILLIRLFELRI